VSAVTLGSDTYGDGDRARLKPTHIKDLRNYKDWGEIGPA